MGGVGGNFRCKCYMTWFYFLSQEPSCPPLLAPSTCFRAVSCVRCERFTARVGWGRRGGGGGIIVLLRAAARRGEKVGKGEKGWGPGGRRAYSWNGFDRGAGLIAIMIRPIGAEG